MPLSAFSAVARSPGADSARCENGERQSDVAKQSALCHCRTHHDGGGCCAGALRSQVSLCCDGVARLLRDEHVCGVRLVRSSVAATQVILCSKRSSSRGAQRGVGAQVAEQQRQHRQQRALVRRRGRRAAQVVRARQP
jgi:hypothetical protein